MNALTISPSRLPMNETIAAEYELDRKQWRVLVEQIFPSAKSVESVLMALAYCRARNLDIFKKPVHIVPMWSSEKKAYVETVWPGIAEIRTTAARTKEYSGADEVIFGPDKTRTFKGSSKIEGKWTDFEVEVTFPVWAKQTVYRRVKGHRSPFTAVVYWEEAYATQGKGDAPNAMWQKRPHGQLAKCVEAAAIRMAFPEEVGSEYTADEMAGQIVDHEPPKLVAVPLVAPPPPPDEPPQDEPQPLGAGAMGFNVEELFARAETWGKNVEAVDDVEAYRDEFGQYLDHLDDEDRQHLEGIMARYIDRVSA